MKSQILFVCTGNTCRSPMAQGLMNAQIQEQNLSEQYDVKSAGVAAFAGSPASIETRNILLDRGIDFEDFRSSKVTQYLLEESDYIFCLSRMHREAILSQFPQFRERALLVGEFLGEEKTKDIADPYGLGDQAYKLVEKQLAVAIENILNFVQQNSELEDSLEETE